MRKGRRNCFQRETGLPQAQHLGKLSTSAVFTWGLVEYWPAGPEATKCLEHMPPGGRGTGAGSWYADNGFLGSMLPVSTQDLEITFFFLAPPTAQG